MRTRIFQRIFEYCRGPWFIRVVSGQLEKWEDATGCAKDLGGAAFSKEAEKVSVFRVHNDLEEAQTIAAFQLRRENTPRKPIIAVRFTYKDLRCSGVQIERSEGETGVRSVDDEHRDLPGDGEQYERLAERILMRQAAGHDSVRRMTKNRILQQLRRLADSGSGVLSEKARERCQYFITKLDPATTPGD